MLALRLEKKLEAKLAALARVRGRTKSEVVREAILRLIEDTEDGGGGKSLAQDPLGEIPAPAQERAWPGPLRSPNRQNVSSANSILKSGAAFSTGWTTVSRDARTPGISVRR